MGFFSWLLGRGSEKPSTRSPILPTSAGVAADLSERHRILNYLRGRWNGQPPDPGFEEASLSSSGLTTLDLAEIISAQVDERHLPEDHVSTFIAIGSSANQKQANLFKRVRILAKQLGEAERAKLLASGVVGDPSEIGPFRAEFDSVGFIVKYCAAIEAWCAEQRSRST